MTVAISKALEAGVSTVICASTGNTAASAAAYAARAGMRAVVLQPHGAVAAAKVAQAGALGARVVQVRGSFDDALASARALADRGTHVLVNSLNPFRIEGQKTAAFEIVEELGRAPDVLALPYGGGGNTRAYARGFAEARTRAARRSSPARRRERGDDACVGDPHRRSGAREEAETPCASRAAASCRSPTRRSSGPGATSPREEGVFCEPSSAAGLAALAEAERRARSVRRLRPDRARAEGPRGRRPREPASRRRRGRSGRHRRGRVVTARRVRAPASTANLGPGFDCAAVALDLWNELEVTEGERRRRSATTSASARSRCSRRPTAGSFEFTTGSRASADSARAPR